jgi:siderophore synthetase component
MFQFNLAKFLYAKALYTESEFWNRLDEVVEQAFDLHGNKFAEQLKDLYFANVRTSHADMIKKLNEVVWQMDPEWHEQLKGVES